MFTPETEDMLPRMAPKPSASAPSGASDMIIRPQVPEVSILFGQQEGSLSQQAINTGIKNIPEQTYAAWKKQMLPKVTYPAPANLTDVQLKENTNNKMTVQDYNSSRINLYPLRPTTTSPLNMGINSFCNIGESVGNPVKYRRSLESCNNMMYQQSTVTLPSQNQLPIVQPLLAQSNSNYRDILTICAGTQTDDTSDSTKGCLQNVQTVPWSNLASKQEVEEVRKILNEIKQEQQNILKMLDMLLYNTNFKAVTKPNSRDIGVQAKEIDRPPWVNGGMALIQELQVDPPQSVSKNKLIQHLKPSNILQTPNGKPIAQSTSYRVNYPQSERFNQDLQEIASAPPSVKPVPITPKAASDTSLAMSELALKYLPNEKLAELLKELNMHNNEQHTTPERINVNKPGKGPSDISNASYKYLKKYRLLPEDHENDDGANKDVVAGYEGESENFNENQMLKYNLPQYNNNMRNTPTHQKQTPTNKCSPYVARRLPLSPLTRVSSPPPQSIGTQQHIVNLENIKQQPKFI